MDVRQLRSYKKLMGLLNPIPPVGSSSWKYIEIGTGRNTGPERIKIFSTKSHVG